MKPEFHKELEKIIGPVKAADFVSRYFKLLRGSYYIDEIDRPHATDYYKARMRHNMGMLLNPQFKNRAKGRNSEEVEAVLFIPTEFARENHAD